MFSKMDIKDASAQKRLLKGVLSSKKKGYKILHDGFHVRACSIDQLVANSVAKRN
jgi:transposase-like protein